MNIDPITDAINDSDREAFRPNWKESENVQRPRRADLYPEGCTCRHIRGHGHQINRFLTVEDCPVHGWVSR